MFISTRKDLIDDFEARIKKDCYRITGGFVGATLICQVLAENKLTDIAFKYLLNEKISRLDSLCEPWCNNYMGEVGIRFWMMEALVEQE